jgi:hypothetical protein
MSRGAFEMLSNHDQLIPATTLSKESPTWKIMFLVFIRSFLKTHIHPISVPILPSSQHPCPTLVLSPLSMSHLQPTIGSMVDLSFLWGLLPFSVHGRSTICTTVPMTSAVTQSSSRSLLLRHQVRYTERDASFSVSMSQQHILITLAYSSATLSKHYLSLFKLHVPSVLSLQKTASRWTLPP